MSPIPDTPYCGAPPVPSNLVWNTDPLLITALCLLAIGYAVGGRTMVAQGCRNQQAAFCVGFLFLVASLVSPLCNLSVALFSARVGQHIVLALIVAPLLAYARTDEVLIRLVGGGSTSSARHLGRGSVLAAAAAFAVALWAWHMPGPYDATLRSDVVYWSMHATSFAAAYLLWRGFLAREACPGAVLVGGLATTVQMSLLGALLTLAGTPLFEAHQATTWPWGLTQLEDQQLGGIIMWAPGGMLFTLLTLLALGRWLHRIGHDPQPLSAQ